MTFSCAAAIFALIIAGIAGVSAVAPINVWPIPREITISPSLSPVNAVIDSESLSKRLSLCIENYSASFMSGDGSDAPYSLIFVSVLSDNEYLSQETDVSYSIEADATSDSMIKISSPSIYGACYALDTLSQLVSGSSLPSSLSIEDSPSFNHRGFMIDTGRRFVPLDLIKLNLDAMFLSRLNVLHLHFADWCRYAIESEAFPALTSNLVGDQAGFYTKAEVTEMITYANDRGIRVVPEVDLPGHSTWGLPLMETGDLKYCTSGHPFSLFDDSDNVTVTTLSAIISEVAELFGPEQLFHIGADETATLNDEGCTIDNIKGMEAKAFQHIIDLKKTPIGWEEVLYKSGGAEGFEGEAVINAWNAGPRPSNITSDGFDAIESLSDRFYLNNKPSWGDIWYDIGSEEGTAAGSVFDKEGSPELLGGEVSMWTDNYCYVLQCGSSGDVDTIPVGAALYPPDMDEQFAASFQGMVWPKAGIGGGSFWNFVPQVGADELTSRIESFNTRLGEQGIDSCPSECTCDETTRCGETYL
mmetsp:Transcript_13172/g.26852  ORF Transcript_13172/g.26852 Transcript_13172/m.26852 type:complete len:529 (-) Transcript_13172:49-1635(-)